jgi:integrase
MIKLKGMQMYNHSVKEEFLSNIKEDTRPSYERIFKMTAGTEEVLGKDVSEFNLNEIEKLLVSFKSKSKNTIEAYGRIISSYLNWSEKTKRIQKNVMEELKTNDFEKFVVKSFNYYTEREIRLVEDFCNNYQDAVIIRLLFLGVGGKKLSEIRNLKIDDVDFKNKRALVKNSLKEDENGNPLKFTERMVELDDRALDFIEKANQEKIYLKKNGDMDFHNNIRPYTDLIKNGYVLKQSLTRNKDTKSVVDKFVLYRRLSTVAELFGIKDFSSKKIQQSGMLNFAKDVVGDEVTVIDLKIIGDKFNINSYHNLKGFITKENIERYKNKNRGEKNENSFFT